MLIFRSTENNYVITGIMDDVQNGQSDHYLIYAVFNPNKSKDIFFEYFIRGLCNEMDERFYSVLISISCDYFSDLYGGK